MKLRLLAILCAAGMLATADGLRPRAVSDYELHARAGDAVVAATVMTARKVKKIFGADLDHAGYVVVEAAFFPRSGALIPVSDRDFLLNGERVVSARVVTAEVERRENRPRGLPGTGYGVYAGGTVGFELGRERGNDRRAVYTGGSVGVGTVPVPAGAVRDVYGLERELADVELKNALTGDAVAGYLYFPKGSAKAARYEVIWNGVKLTIQ